MKPQNQTTRQGVVSVPLTRMPVQLRIDSNGEPPTASKVKAFDTSRRGPGSLPNDWGGIWTATAKLDGTSSWCNAWMRRRFNAHLLHPEPARVYTVDNLDDIKRLAARYGAQGSILNRIAEDYDAVHLTERGLRAAGARPWERNEPS